MSGRCWLPVFGVLALFVGAEKARAQSQCTAEKALQQRSFADALRGWETEHRAWIEPEFRAAMAVDFCAASARVVAEMRATPAQVDNVAAGTIADFLRPYLLDEVGRTMSSALRARLGVQGLFRPAPRRKGTILFTYRRDVDSLVLAGARMAPVDRIIISPGPKAFSGFLGSRPICRGSVTVIAARIVKADC